jgi:hypothetical protein
MLASGGSAIRAIQVLKVKLTELMKLMRGTKLTITGKTQNKETVPSM